MIEIKRIIRSRRKTIALIVEGDGSLVVRAPLNAADELIREVVERKAIWITRTREKLADHAVQAAPRKYANGELFWYLGSSYPLEIIPNAGVELELNGAFRLSATALPRAPQTFERWYRLQARAIIPGRVEQLAKRLGWSFRRVRISSARTRWGSCSAGGTLSFSWRLVMTPTEVIDYVILHELMHLQVCNHSPAFWAGLRTLMPDYADKIAWLKRYGPQLVL